MIIHLILFSFGVTCVVMFAIEALSSAPWVIGSGRRLVGDSASYRRHAPSPEASLIQDYTCPVYCTETRDLDL